MHPGSPPGWESQLPLLQEQQKPTNVHPGSPPGWGSKLAHRIVTTLGRVHPAARRGGSLNDEFEWVTSHVFRRCTPAARRGGVSTSPHWCGPTRTPRAPGSPPGESLNMTDTPTIVAAAGRCTPAARRGGVSTSTGHRPCPSTTTHPGSPPGWGVSTPCPMCNQPVEWRAPRQPAGVGVSTISTDGARG